MIRPLLSALGVCALLASTATALAHPGHAHKILGTVTAVTATSLEVLDRCNEKTTFAITKATATATLPVTVTGVVMAAAYALLGVGLSTSGNRYKTLSEQWTGLAIHHLSC